jgi:hypothetical protein
MRALAGRSFVITDFLLVQQQRREREARRQQEREQRRREQEEKRRIEELERRRKEEEERRRAEEEKRRVEREQVSSKNVQPFICEVCLIIKLRDLGQKVHMHVYICIYTFRNLDIYKR